MTTSIRVSAHCTDDKEVQINYDDTSGPQQKILQNGEEFDLVVYDDMELHTVKEVLKEQPQPMNGDGQTRPPKDDQ